MIRTISVKCLECDGRGYQHATELHRGKRVDVGVPCHSCQQTGVDSFEFDCCDTCGEACCDCPDVIEEAPVSSPPPVVYLGGIVDAPGFTTATFAAGVAKAQRFGTLHMEPGFAGTVLVTSPQSGTRYAVRRHDCSCKAGQTHGHCYHRAAVLYAHDVCGVNVGRESVLGFDPAGNPIVYADTAGYLQEVA